MRHWINPYSEALDIPIEELLDHASSAYSYDLGAIRRRARLIEMLSQYTEGLDSYILPSPSGHHSLGIRYGNEPHQYMSFDTKWGSKELEDLLSRAKAHTQEIPTLIP